MVPLATHRDGHRGGQHLDLASSAIEHRMIKNELFTANSACGKGDSIASQLPTLVKSQTPAHRVTKRSKGRPRNSDTPRRGPGRPRTTTPTPKINRSYAGDNSVDNGTYVKEEDAEYNTKDDASKDKNANYHSAGSDENEMDRISHVRGPRDKTKCTGNEYLVHCVDKKSKPQWIAAADTTNIALEESWAGRVRAGTARTEPVRFKPVVAISSGPDATDDYNMDETKNEDRDMANVVHHKGAFKIEEMPDNKIHADSGKVLEDTLVIKTKTLSRRNFTKRTALGSVRSIVQDIAYEINRTIAMHSTADLPILPVKSAEQAALVDRFGETPARGLDS